MNSRFSVWFFSKLASVLMFLGQRLETLGKVIACETERSYAGAAAQWWQRKRSKSATPR
ncbi:MAG: hypothetical protein WBZ11_19145 [Candidatus Sulfotelmatobacter sp.]|jgi:hypothetical protein